MHVLTKAMKAKDFDYIFVGIKGVLRGLPAQMEHSGIQVHKSLFL